MLVALLVTLSVLYRISITGSIHQSVFVYSLNLRVLDTAATLAPYSIIPTLLAVGLKLWFGAIGDTIKLLQPYVSMVRAPTKLVSSLLADYINTPLVLLPPKAIKLSHWTLALVGFGALATEICTYLPLVLLGSSC